MAYAPTAINSAAIVTLLGFAALTGRCFYYTERIFHSWVAYYAGALFVL